MRRTALALMPLARAIRSAVQWVVSTGGSASVRNTTRAATSGPSGGMREGRVLLAAPLKSIPNHRTGISSPPTSAGLRKSWDVRSKRRRSSVFSVVPRPAHFEVRGRASQSPRVGRQRGLYASIALGPKLGSSLPSEYWSHPY